jgi:hypothetical protein
MSIDGVQSMVTRFSRMEFSRGLNFQCIFGVHCGGGVHT